MPSAARRRRAIQKVEEESDEERIQSTQQNRRRALPSEDESEEDVGEEAGDEEMVDVEPDSQDQVVKKLVRYALACEFQRTSIKRVGITEKVIGKQRGSFKKVFESAQKQLRTRFGMEMFELPVKEKITLKEKRAAQKTKGNSKPATSYILKTILPTEYRIPKIMPPSIIGSAEEEAAYMGLCSVIVSMIALSPGGSIPDHKLMSHLKRFNSDTNTGLDTTVATLQRMIKHGYLVKSVDRGADEETIDWRVGPRGKVEIGNQGIQGLVREVYGDSAPDDLEKRLQRSLGMEIKRINAENEEGDEAEEQEHANGDAGPSNTRTNGRMRRVTAEE